MFETRSKETEVLDQPDCDPALAATCYRFMEVVNHYFGGVRIVRRLFEELAQRRDAGIPLRILDIGSGSCDIPLAISRWAKTRGLAVQFTCLEIGGPATSIARAKLARANDPAVRLLMQDAFTYQPDEPYDWAVASLCFHHFDDEQILSLLRRLQGFVREGVLINDLRRSLLASSVAIVVTALAPPGARHDALASIRRGFKVAELRALLEKVDGTTVSVERAWWFRIAARVRFASAEPRA